MNEGRINELMGKVATLRGEIAHAAAEYAKVGGDPKMVGVTAAEVAAGLEEAVREVKRYRGILRGLGACIGSAYDLLPEQFRPDVETGGIPSPNTLAISIVADCLAAGVTDEHVRRIVTRSLEDEYLGDHAAPGTEYLLRLHEQVAAQDKGATVKHDEERPASSKTEPAPPLEEFTPDLSVDKLPDGDPGMPFDPVPDDPAKVLQASPKPDVPYDPNDATVKGRKRAAEAELLVSEWTPSTALIAELGLDPEWAKGEGLDSFRARMDQSIRLARWGHRFKAWVGSNPDQVKRKVVECGSPTN